MNKNFVAGLVIIAALAGGVWYLNNSGATGRWDSVAGSWSKGPDNAPITIVEYSDFQCPACQRAQSTLDSIMTKHEGKVRLVFRHFPLSGHLWSDIAHRAAECAGRQGKFWEYHDLLYDGQASWSGPVNPTEGFIRYAREAGLDVENFAACLPDASVKEKIEREKMQGELQKLTSTPTFFINGERFVGQIQLEVEGRKFIEKKLGAASSESSPAA